MKKITIKRLSVVLLLLLITVTGAVKFTQAIFKDEELSSHTISLGTLNLKIGQEDPVNLPIDLSDMSGHETRTYEVDLKNTGSVAGNFWFETEILNSLEGENPQAETNTEGEGEADDCIQLLVSVTDPDHEEEVLVNSALSAMTTDYDQDAQTVVDDMVNNGNATMKLRFYSGNCGSDAMGDTVDMNLLFHLDQAS